MSTHKIDVTIKGQLIGPGYFISLEGHEVRLHENPAHVYKRSFTAVPVQGPLDVVIVLRGWYGTEYSADLSVDGTSRIQLEGTFPVKGVVTISRQITLSDENI